MGFRRSRGSAKERDAPQTIYCTAVCLTSTRAVSVWRATSICAA